MDEAKLGDLEGRGSAEYRNQAGDEPRLAGFFEGDAQALMRLAERREPLRFEGVALDHARKYRVVVMVTVFRVDARGRALFRAVGEPEIYAPLTQRT